MRHPATLLIAEAFGEGWWVEEQQTLNSRDDVRVLRLQLRKDTAQRGVILKHRLCAPGEDYHFIVECANYVFLDALGDAFPLRPKFLGLENNLLLIEDLGVDKYNFQNDTEIVVALAEIFAQLHAATAGKEKAYDAVRARFGLPDGPADRRRYGETGSRQEAERGAGFFIDRISFLGLGFEAALREQLQRAIEIVCDPQSIFRTFVHDDLADRRQSITIDGRIHLIDFELSKYFHGLMDLAKLLIGKIEMDHTQGGMRHNHPGLPTHLPQVYRTRRATIDHTTWSDEEWNENIGAAMIMQALIAIERMRAEGGLAMLHTMTATLKSILQRLRLVLEGNPAYASFSQMLAQVQVRIIG